MIPSQDFQLLFLKKLQRIFNDGQFVATYKFALLHALASLCLERQEDEGGGLALTPKDLAGKFLELYWEQARPFSGDVVLRASTGAQAEIITRLLAMRRRYRTFAQFRRGPHFKGQAARAASLIVKMPLWKLQTLGGEKDEFLYPNELEAGAVVLRPGVAFCLRQFYPLVVQLVRGHWTQHLFSIPANQGVLGPQADLEAFLFGSDRACLAQAAPVLMDLQHGQCFYCGKGLGDQPQVDHFVAWARYPRDLAHNLVLADAACNNDKRDTLPAQPHLERWLQRNADLGAKLEAALRDRLVCDLPTASMVARWSYQSDLSSGARLWQGRGAYAPCDPAVLAAFR